MKHAIRHVHFVGIGGAGMSGIAEILHNLGYAVSGSDLSDSPTLQRLQTMGIQTRVGHDAQHIFGADAVVTSTAVQADNPEVLRAKVRVFVELYRKTRQLEALNADMIGIDRLIALVRRVAVDTSAGRTDEAPGFISTSSKVKYSGICRGMGQPLGVAGVG